MRILFVIYFLILHLSLFGQEFYFKNIGTAQGLPSSETYHSLQDSKGYIWFTTDAGICRYDGKRLTTYTTKDGLPENVVFNIYEDRHGRIWFSSLSGYIFYYERGVFKNISAQKELLEMNSGSIRSFFLGEKDTLYLTTSYTFGIIKISPQNNYKNISVQKVQIFLPETNGHYIIVNKLNKKEILIGGVGEPRYNKTRKDTVCRFDARKLFVISFIEASASIYRGTIDNEGNIYLPNKKQLAVFIAKDNRLEYYNFLSEIIFINQDKNGDLWVGTKMGGYFYKKSDLKLKPIYFLTEFSLSDIMIDKENNIWVCSLQKGIFKSINKDVFDLFFKNDNVCNFSKYNSSLYVGFASNKLIEVKTDNSIFYSFIKARNLPDSSTLNHFYKTEYYSYYGINDNLFYAENNNSIELRDPRIINAPNIPMKKTIRLGIDSFAIEGFREIYILKKQKILFSMFPPFFIKSMIQLNNKTLLIGSRNNEGIYQYRQNNFFPYLKEFSQLKTRINDLVEDSDGKLWIATNEKGLFCYSNNKLYEFNEKNGLNSNKVNELDLDQNGNVWIATNLGLNKITIANGLDKAKISGFNASHGLPNLEIEHLTVFNNKVWCSAKEHLFYFDCDKMITNNVPPLTYIKSIQINDSSVNISAAPVLTYNQNNITFEFTGITFKNTDKKEYLYKLNGYETEWRSSSTGECQYTSLPYGAYTFEVFALNNDNVRSALPAAFNFTILKPFWFTWWFIIIEIILLIAFVYLIIKWRVNKIKKNEEEKTLINKKLAEFQMTAIRAQMNPHFVFNAISSIQHYILTNDKYNSYDYLAKFSRLIRNVLDNSKKEYISLEKEIITLCLYIELEKIRFKLPFKFSLKVDEDLDQSEIDIPTMIIQPYIENAIWHGLMPKQNDCSLELTINKMNADLQITIKDNGLGRKAAARHKKKDHISKGMELMDERLKALSVKNNRAFSVSIIDLTDKKGDSLGTEVKIIMPIETD